MSMIKQIVITIRDFFLDDLISNLKKIKIKNRQQSGEYLDWIHEYVVVFVEEYVTQYQLIQSQFISMLNKEFTTDRFNFLLKRWIAEYFVKIFSCLYDSYILQKKQLIRLEDNPLNRFAVEKFEKKFSVTIPIRWTHQPIVPKIFAPLIISGHIIFSALKSGICFNQRKEKYKVLREVIRGVDVKKRKCFVDEFIIDGDLLKKDDVLFYSRKHYKNDIQRLNAFNQLKTSKYRHVELDKLSVSVSVLKNRIFKKYIFRSGFYLWREALSPQYSLYLNIHVYFLLSAIPYERLFSNFEITSELGHNYFSASHIAESIVCQSHSVSYCLLHGSDNSIGIDRHLLSYLSCDKNFIWEKSQLSGTEGRDSVEYIGYHFVDLIQKTKLNKANLLAFEGIKQNGCIVSFFDEAFGGSCKMQASHFINFWKAAVQLAKSRENVTVLIHAKILNWVDFLDGDHKRQFLGLMKEIETVPNLYLVTGTIFTFIETIAISDLVVTQGMCSSSTIALISGVPALYLDEAKYKHIISKLYKNELVFTDSEKFLRQIYSFIDGNFNPLKVVSSDMLMSFNLNNDSFGADRMRRILADPLTKQKKYLRTGIVIQAETASEFLTGKVLLDLAGKPILEHVLDRALKCAKADTVIVATTESDVDLAIVQLCRKLGVDCYRGNEHDVLERYYETAVAFNLDVVVRITADCPVVDPQLIDEMLTQYLNKVDNGEACHYFSNTVKRTFPKGLDVEVFDFYSLVNSYALAKSNRYRKDVTLYMSENPDKFVHFYYQGNKDYSSYQFKLDVLDDYRVMKEIYESLYKPGHIFYYQDIINLLNQDKSSDTRKENVSIHGKN